VVWEGEASDARRVADAVQTCSRGFADWASLEPAIRAERLTRFAEVLAKKRAAIVELLVREAGKSKRYAEAEADLLAKKITVSLGPGLLRTPGFNDVKPGPGDAAVVFRPRGVAAVLGPYNFPLHLLHGLVVPALAVGATVVAKPSEHCPALGELYGTCLEEAGLADVARVVLGGASVAAELVRHDAIATVAAVGGRSMGKALQRLLVDRPEVVLALELGGVNPALVCDDADLERAVAAIGDGAFGMVGQRCTATRIAHVPRARLSELREALAEERLRHRASEDVGMLISQEARAAFVEAHRALPQGLTLVAGSLEVSAEDCATDPLLLEVSDGAARTSARYREEHFGPGLILDPYDRLEEAVERMAENPYRLAASVFTEDGARFLGLARRLHYGQVNHNRPTAGARSDRPFGGCGKSGNGRPAALAAGGIFADETVVWLTADG
jgi:succinylglutamic semialdehyde dehydrogenase